MKIRYVTGSLMEAAEPYILHGCNAQGVMGSGVAKLIRDRNEKVFTDYRIVYEAQGNRLDLGQIIIVPCDDHIYINGITQEFYGRDPNRVYVSYEGMRAVMRELNRLAASQDDDVKIAMPLIGAGLANGKWSIISQIIEEESTDFEPVVYLLDGVIPE